METKVSLLCSQEPVSGPNPELGESTSNKIVPIWVWQASVTIAT
jgi:hypothetical protein